MPDPRIYPIAPSKSTLAIAVISDIHAYSGVEDDKAPSDCCITETDPSKNALCGLRDFISRERLRADLLFCPGDLGDKAQPEAIQHAWRELHDLKQLLKARDVIATTGNHDVDSRFEYTGYDAKGFLQSLEPAYPFANARQSDQYWARNYVIVDRPSFRVLILNSSAFHGEGSIKKLDEREYMRGRISDHTLSHIRRELLKLKTPRPVNLLLCHHHPHPYAEFRTKPDDLMIGGDLLLGMLDTGEFGNWMVVHGHNHRPRIEYAAGGASAPIVFAAASVAAALWKNIQHVPRQFYIFEYPLDLIPQLGLVGRFKAWEWAYGDGWAASPLGEMLPGEGGFGWRSNIEVLAREVAQEVQSQSTPWKFVVEKLPHLRFLLPQDIVKLAKCLTLLPEIHVECHDHGPPVMVGRRTS